MKKHYLAPDMERLILTATEGIASVSDENLQDNETELEF